MFREMFITEKAQWEWIEDRKGDYAFIRFDDGSKAQLDGGEGKWSLDTENGKDIKRGSSIKELNALLKKSKITPVSDELYAKVQENPTAYK